MLRHRRFLAVVVAGAVALGAVVAVTVSGDSSPEPARTKGVRFTKGVVAGTDTTKVTTLRFGPDGRLYAGQQTGIIRALTLERQGPGRYRVASRETIGSLVDRKSTRLNSSHGYISYAV